jgi:hypothetical protein
MGPDYLAGLFGRIIHPWPDNPPPTLKISEKWLRTWLGVNQTWGWIIWPDISFLAG